MKRTFEIGEIFQVSWKYTKTQLPILCGLLIGYIIIAFTINLFALPWQDTIGGKIVSTLIGFCLSGLFMLGYTKNVFQTLDEIEPQFSAYGQQARKIFTYVLANILFAIIFSIAFALFIVPGVYVALRLQFFVQFIVEEDAGIIESLRRSWEISQGNVLNLFLLTLVIICIAILGALLLGVGIFIAMPLITTMLCYTFRKLNSPRTLVEEA